MNFERALAFTLAPDHEGGYADRPNDPGGPTMRGVTQATYDHWRDDHHLPRRPVKEIDDAELRDIYFRRYWLAYRCDQLPWPVSLVLFDTAVLIARPVELLQATLGEKVDGLFGPKTLESARTSDPVGVARALVIARIGYHVANRHLKENPGWLSRAYDLIDAIEDDR